MVGEEERVYFCLEEALKEGANTLIVGNNLYVPWLFSPNPVLNSCKVFPWDEFPSHDPDLQLMMTVTAALATALVLLLEVKSASYNQNMNLFAHSSLY